MKKVLSLLLVAAFICSVFTGCTAPPPPEGSEDGPFVRVEPAGEGEGTDFSAGYFYYTCAMQDVASYISAVVRCRVDGIYEYKFRPAEGSNHGDKYQSCYSCTVTDSIYGDMKKGSAFNVLDESCSYWPYGCAYKIEQGREYILFIAEIKDRGPAYFKPDSQIYDFKALSDYTLRSREFGVMAVDGDTVTYRKGYGDFGGAAKLDGVNKLVGAEEQGYTAKYDIVKKEIQKLVGAEKAAEELSANPDELYDPAGIAPYWPLDPAEKPIMAAVVEFSNKTFTPQDVLKNAAHIARIRVDRLQDYALRDMGSYNPYHKEYCTLVHCTYLDSIADAESPGSMKNGEKMAFVQYTSTYCPMPRTYIFEEGKEYIVILRTFGKNAGTDALLAPYRLTNNEYSVMPIDDEGNATYHYIFGDMGGKATYNGQLLLRDAGRSGYKAKYEDVKQMFHDMIADD